MDKMTKKILGAFTAILVIAAIILAVFFMINKQEEKKAETDVLSTTEAETNVLPTTEVGKLLAKDLETKYPGTATEVVKLYWRINCCLYNEDTSDKDVEAVLKQMRKLYDEEFLQDENNSYDKMLKKLMSDKEKRLDAKQVFVSKSVIVQANDTLKIVKMDGRDCTEVISSIMIKAKKSEKVYERFVCRQDSKGNWKIMGWQQVSKADAEKVDVE